MTDKEIVEKYQKQISLYESGIWNMTVIINAVQGLCDHEWVEEGVYIPEVYCTKCLKQL